MQNDENNNESRFFVKICPIKGLSGNVWDRGCKAGRYTKEGKISGDFARKGKKGEMIVKKQRRFFIMTLVTMLFMTATGSIQAQTRARTDPLTGYTSLGYYNANMTLYEYDLQAWVGTAPYISSEEMYISMEVYYALDADKIYSASKSGYGSCRYTNTSHVIEARTYYQVDGVAIGDLWLSIPNYL